MLFYYDFPLDLCSILSCSNYSANKRFKSMALFEFDFLFAFFYYRDLNSNISNYKSRDHWPLAANDVCVKAPEGV